MKRFKKVLALLLVISMLCPSLAVYASGSVEHTSEAKVLNLLGLFQGVNPDKFDPDLEGDLTKGDALIMMSRIFNWDLESTKGKKIPFTDVEPWQVDAVTYAYVNGITLGDGNKSLIQEMTVKQLVTLVLRELGYKSNYAWENALELALKEDLLTFEGILDAEDEAIRDDLVGVCYQALMAVPQGEKLTVIEILIEEGVVDEDIAVDAGLIEEPEPEEFEVLDIEPISLVQTLVEFTSDVDDDSLDTDDFEIDGDDALDVELEDDRTVLVTHEKVSNGSKVSVEVDNVKGMDGEEADAVEDESVHYLDKEFPEVVDAEVFGEREIRVEFSEMMQSFKTDLADEFDGTDHQFNVESSEFDEDGFTVYKENGKKAGIKAIHRNPNNYNAVDITMSSDLNDDETYTIKIDADCVDFAGYGIYEEIEVDVELLTDEPEVVDYDVESATEITLIFNRDIQLEGSKDDFYHTNTSNKVKELPQVDGKELTLTFYDSDKLPEGIGYIYIEEDAIEDLYGNAVDTIKVVIEREEDKTPPIVSDIEQVDGDDDENKYFEITFVDSDLDEDSATDKDTYIVYDEDDDEVDIRRVTLDDDGDKVTIELKDEVSGEITLYIDGLEDTEGNDMNKSKFTFDMNDEIRPKLKNTKVTFHEVDDDLVIRVEYEKEMSDDGEYSVLEPSNYQLVDGNKLYDVDDDIEDVDLELSDEGDVVTITIPEDDENDVFWGILHEDWELVIARVADVSGNLTKELTYAFDIEGGDDTVKLVDDDDYNGPWVRAISSEIIEVRIDDYVSVEDDDFKLYYDYVNDNRELDININEDYDDGDTIVEIEIDDYEINADGTVTVDEDDGPEELILCIAAEKENNGDYIPAETVNDLDTPLAPYPNLEVYDFIEPEFDDDATEDFVVDGSGSNAVSQGTEVEVSVIEYNGYIQPTSDNFDTQVRVDGNQAYVVYTLVFNENVEFNNQSIGKTDFEIEFDNDNLKAGSEYDVVTFNDSNMVEIHIYLDGNDADDYDGRYYITVEDAQYLGDRDDNESATNYVEDFTWDFDISIETTDIAGSLTVTAADDDQSSDHTVISVEEQIGYYNDLKYLLSEMDVDLIPYEGMVVVGAKALPSDGIIEAESGQYVLVFEVDQNDKVIRYGKTIAVVEIEDAGTLNVTASDDNDNNTHTVLSVQETLGAGNKFVYLVSDESFTELPYLGMEALDTWSNLPSDGSIEATNGDYVLVVEVDSSNEVVRYGITNAVVEVEAAGSLTVTASDDDDNNTHTIINVSEELGNGNNLVYTVSSNVYSELPYWGMEALNEWDDLPANGSIEADNGDYVLVVEVDSNNKVVRYGIANAIVEAEVAGSLTVTALDDESNSTHTVITVEEELADGNKLVYIVSQSPFDEYPYWGMEALTEWSDLPSSGSIEANNGDFVLVIVVDSSNKVVAYGRTIAVVEVEEAGSLTVTASDDNTNNTHTIITVEGVLGDGHKLVYDVSQDSFTEYPYLGMEASVLWEDLPTDGSIEAANGEYVLVVEIDGYNKVVKYGIANAIVEDEEVGSLTVTATDDDSNNTHTVITVTEVLGAENKLVYAVSETAFDELPYWGMEASGLWEDLPTEGSIEATNGDYVMIIEIDGSNKVVKYGMTNAIVEVEPAGALTVSATDDESNNTHTVITVVEALVEGNKYLYTVSSTVIVEYPYWGMEAPVEWVELPEDRIIEAINGDYVMVVEVDINNLVVNYGITQAVVN
ncbi:hypothetical protein [Vallitalea okinawensis]|uniref:hypothetical protein n=1 Tax=Vallitalea okinawensis TaxID=2078660 RepID=UPI000CFB058D|nr:hypothetical protein [Vallitalea okinawensis]